MNPLTWFNGLQPTEQRKLRLAASIGTVTLIVIASFSLGSAVEARRIRVEQKRADLAWIEAVSPRIQALPVVRAGQSLPLAVDRVAQETGVAGALAGAEPAGNGALRVRFEAAGFDALVLWLARLQQERAAVVESATVEALSEVGRVNASLVLRAP